MSPASPPASRPPPGRTDQAVHKRYLEYRDKHVYFGKTTPQLTMAQFIPLEQEFQLLEVKGEDGRDDEEAARWAELAAILFRD